MRSGLPAALLLALFQLARAEDGVAVGANLLEPIGGRAAAMGEAYVSAEDDVFGVFYNPAVHLRHRQAAALLQKGVVGDETFGALAVGVPMKWGRLGGMLLQYRGGDIDLNSEAEGRTVQSQSDLLAGLSASVTPLERVAIGANLKYLRSTLVEEFTASTFLLDLGGLWRATPETTIGVSLANLGPGLKYSGERENLLVVARAGASHRFQFLAHKVLASFQLERSDDGVHPNLGGEYFFGGFMALRLGYRAGKDIGAFTMGFGMTWDRYTMDYAFIPGSELSASHRVSVGVKF